VVITKNSGAQIAPRSTSLVVRQKLSPSRIPALIKEGKNTQGEYLRIVWQKTVNGGKYAIIVPVRVAPTKPRLHQVKRRVGEVMARTDIGKLQVECLVVARAGVVQAEFKDILQEAKRLVREIDRRSAGQKI